MAWKPKYFSQTEILILNAPCMIKIDLTLLDLKNRANKNVRLDDNQTSVVSNFCISGRNEIAGANPVQSCY